MLIKLDLFAQSLHVERFSYSENITSINNLLLISNVIRFSDNAVKWIKGSLKSKFLFSFARRLLGRARTICIGMFETNMEGWRMFKRRLCPP